VIGINTEEKKKGRFCREKQKKRNLVLSERIAKDSVCPSRKEKEEEGRGRLETRRREEELAQLYRTDREGNGDVLGEGGGNQWRGERFLSYLRSESSSP